MPAAHIRRRSAPATRAVPASAERLTAFFSAIQLSWPYSRASACWTSRSAGVAGAVGIGAVQSARASGSFARELLQPALRFFSQVVESGRRA